MSNSDDLKGPYIVWEDYGCEDWKPTSYPTPKAALVDAPRYNKFILTKALVFDVIEIDSVIQQPQPVVRSHFDKEGCDPPQWHGPTGE